MIRLNILETMGCYDLVSEKQCNEGLKYVFTKDYMGFKNYRTFYMVITLIGGVKDMGLKIYGIIDINK